jgi:UDP-glucose 4-epimerase
MPIKSGPVLVVGGAGYIGSHMVLALKQAGIHTIVLDNLSHGHRDAVIDAELIVGDMGDRGLLEKIFTTYSFSTVMHFASLIEVEGSIYSPLKYYQNNVAKTLTLLEAMQAFKVKQIIFSSSAAVYGLPQVKNIVESHPLLPINPYGRSKLMVETIIQDFAKSDGLRYAIFRYFNAAGADPLGRASERHQPESHLIPLVLEVALKSKPMLTIYGNQYDTYDGTCIRDYVHVVDVCEAHLLAMYALNNNEQNILCNLGTGRGFSVMEVVNVASQITGKKIRFKVSDKRPGDPPYLVANADLAKTRLAWQPKYSTLETMIEHAMKRHQLNELNIP